MLFLDKVLSVDTLDKNPSVIFLPGHLFFAKSIELPQGIDRRELDSFVEIALEENAPFPINQVYYGAFHAEGSRRVLIYSAYRKRFTSDEKELWEEADLVLPDFVSLFGLVPGEPTLYLLVQASTVSGVYFDGSDPVPVEVIARHFDPEASPGARKARLDEITGRMASAYGETPVRYYRREGEVSRHAGKLGFSVLPATEEGEAGEAAGAETVSLDRPVVSALDIRDKTFLEERRKTAVRDAWFWRSTVSLAVLLAILAIGEVAFHTADAILTKRRELVENRADRVAMINEQLELAERMEELGENQLLPFEMLAILNEHRPPSLHFTQALTDGWNALQVNAVTRNSRDVEAYENALRDSGNLESLEVRNQRLSDGRTTFNLFVRFDSEMLRQRSPVAEVSSRNAARLTAAGETRAREGGR